MKKTFAILFSASLALSFAACKSTPPNQEQQQDTKTDTQTKDDGQSDAKSDDSQSDAQSDDSQSDAKSDDSQSDAQSDDAKTDDEQGLVSKCIGPSSYKDMAGFGKVKLGYPCNIDDDCEGYIAGQTSIECDMDAYFCNDYNNPIETIEAKNLPNFYPCFDNDQCASGHCESLDENLNFCTPKCQANGTGDENFTCEQDGTDWVCKGNLERESVKEGASCIHEIYDCGWNMECYNGKCAPLGE